MSSSRYKFDDWEMPVLLIDDEGYLRSLNHAASSVFESASGSMIGKHLSNVASMMPKHRQRWVTAMYSHQSKTVGGRGLVELQCVDRAGSVFDAAVTFETAPNSGEGWCWVHIDPLTEQNRRSQHTDDVESPTVRDLIASLPRSLASGDDVVSVGGLLSAMAEFDSLFNKIADTIAESIDYDKVCIATVDLQRQEICLCHVRYSDRNQGTGRPRGATFPLNGTVSEAAVEAGQPLLLQFPDSSAMRARFPKTSPSEVVPTGISTIIAPLIFGGVVLGVLALQSVKANAYTDSDLKFISQLMMSPEKAR